jgi:hypothetical protein
MYTSLRATSQTLAAYLRQQFAADPRLRSLFHPGSGGSMQVSLNTPKEMADNHVQGLSIWLYRLVRDEERLNAPPQRLDPEMLLRPPLPLRLHYLMTPITAERAQNAVTEQEILGKVLQLFHDQPSLRGTLLQDELAGTDVELNIRLESMSLDETSRVWEALEGSYQLSVSYEVSVVEIASALEPEHVRPIRIALPEYGLIVGE